MKRFALVLITMLGMSYAYGQYPTVSADSLKYFEGKVITVCHEVTSTFVTKSANKTTFLNFGDFPSQKFTVVIFNEDLKNFKYEPAEFLKGKTLCITGDVRMYNCGPEIIVEQEEQIRIK